MTGLASLRSFVTRHTARASVRWIALLLVSATIIATAAGSYRAIDKQLTGVALSRREAVARLAAVTMAEKFGRIVDVGISLSTRVHFRDLVTHGKWDEAIAIMHNVPRDLPQIERLFLADAGGTLRSDTPALPGVRGKNFAFREWYRGVSRDWRPYISSVYTRTAVPRINVIAVAVPVRNPDGKVTGVLVLQIRIESLSRWLEALDLGPQAFIYLVDSKGRLAFHSRHRNQQGIVDLAGTPVVQKLRQRENGVETGFDPTVHEEAITAYATVPGYGWGVITQQPKRASRGLAARDEQLRQLLTGYGIILLLSTVAIFQTSRAAVARRQFEDDRRLKAELERRVTERTTELTRANDLRLAEITERERAEHRFRDLLESAPDAIVIADKEGRIVLANSQAHQWFGYERNELNGQPVDILLPERFRERHAGHRANYLAAPRTRPMGSGLSLFGRRKDGSEFPVEISLSPIETADGVWTTGVIRDITQRRRNEEYILRLNEELQQRAVELEATNRELAAFSYSVSHDLRAPLRSIDGFGQALLEDCADRLDEQGRQYLQRIRNATQRMGMLIDDLLMLSRVTRAEMRREAVDLTQLTQSVITGLEVTEPGRKVEYRLQTGMTADGDPRLMRIVLENLLNNAWKFTRHADPARIEISARTDESGTRVYCVRDNGVGFDMTYADKLFGAFQRLHSPSDFPGTGIGLATVQRIIHRHGGRVWAESESGRGASFYFTLDPSPRPSPQENPA
jgi:PAS domain S-box-containing protein